MMKQNFETRSQIEHAEEVVYSFKYEKIWKNFKEKFKLKVIFEKKVEKMIKILSQNLKMK